MEEKTKKNHLHELEVKNVKEKIKKNKTIHEFMDFIKKGNVFGLAIGVVIGTAFNAIVNSLVNDIIMPLVGILIGGFDFTKLSVEVSGVPINYGMFIQNVVNFLIIALSMFVTIKVMSKLFAHPEPPKEEDKPAPKPETVVLLEEIRDLLKDEPKSKKKK